MKTKVILLTLLAIGASLAACGRQAPTVTTTHSSHSETQAKTSTQPVQSQARVPAFQDVKSIGNLPPTLQPEQFFGPTRDAYRAAQEIPETIAQLPCYCHCDQSLGHKSLHSCFQDTHASQCAVCVNEALIAYNMQKSGMTPAQIRERIIAQYSRQ
jgi:predicted small lipoprotein YifL